MARNYKNGFGLLRQDLLAEGFEERPGREGIVDGKSWRTVGYIEGFLNPFLLHRHDRRELSAVNFIGQIECENDADREGAECVYKEERFSVHSV